MLTCDVKLRALRAPRVEGDRISAPITPPPPPPPPAPPPPVSAMVPGMATGGGLCPADLERLRGLGACARFSKGAGVELTGEGGRSVFLAGCGGVLLAEWVAGGILVERAVVGGVAAAEEEEGGSDVMLCLGFSAVCMFGLAPFCRRTSTNLCSPFRAAMWMGVSPCALL